MLVTSQQLDIVIPTKKLKILFYHAGVNDWFYPAALQFKTYIELYYPDTAAQLEWLIPIQNRVDDQTLIAHIKTTQADLLCTSHYLWNHDYLEKQLERVSTTIKPTVKIISGGPSINVNDDPEFFKKYPWADYAVFAAGEQAMADILTHLVFDKPLIGFNTSNCAWQNKDTGKVVVADYKFVKMIETSPFVYNAKMFADMAADFLEKNNGMWLPYTLTRGCPYSCTFCDWNSGLSNKVSRRKNTYREEIDLFQKLGIKNIYLSDANVGQYDEDVEMIEYFAQKNIEENAKFHVGGNFSKLKKENNLKIFHAMARGKLVNKTFNLSIQDTNREILKNINRPDVGWEVHVAMADELRKNYPYLYVKAQLICGLPGQTIETWKHTLEQVVQQNIFPIIFFNEPLPASPAMYDPEYQRQFQFEYTHSIRILNEIPYRSLIPKQSKSFSQHDLVHMTTISNIFQALSAIKLVMIENELEDFDVVAIADELINSPNYQRLCENLLQNWAKDNNFYYTLDFSGYSVISGDMALGSWLAANPEFGNYVSNNLPKHLQLPFSRLFVSKQISQAIIEIFSDFD